MGISGPALNESPRATYRPMRSGVGVGDDRSPDDDVQPESIRAAASTAVPRRD